MRWIHRPYSGRGLHRTLHPSSTRTPGLSSIVPSEVQQQSDNFSYSDVEQGRTIFTVRASHATEFKDQNRALLQDVWITVYGRKEIATTTSTPANAATNPHPAVFAARGSTN